MRHKWQVFFLDQYMRLSGYKACWRLAVCCVCAIYPLAALSAEKDEQRDAGPFVRALWFVQRYGTLEAADPKHDEQTKALLTNTLAKDGTITNRAIASKLMNAKTYQALAGADESLDASEVCQALDADVPETRRGLLPEVAAHFEALSTSFDRIDAAHLAAGEKLAEWIVANYQPQKPLPILFVCKGNSRRSIIGATMGNVAADYWGLPEARCYSGGTAPSAFNPRTIATLKAIGIEIEPTGQEAERGAEGSRNPMYFVRWGQSEGNGSRTMETVEFSKHYGDAANPQSGFAAIMVCTQADAECPYVKGASRRISMPYLDPKCYDDSAYETAKYAERRDDLGRLMLAVMLKARRQLEATRKLAAAGATGS